MIVVHCAVEDCQKFFTENKKCACGKDPCDTRQGGCQASLCPDHIDQYDDRVEDMVTYRVSKDYDDEYWKAVVIAGGYRSHEDADNFLRIIKQFVEDCTEKEIIATEELMREDLASQDMAESFAAGHPV